MRFKAAIANALWVASNLPASLRFGSALKAPEIAQRLKLRSLLSRNANTAFGKLHDFSSINSYHDFCRRVPLADYASIEPWIARISAGEQRVLTLDPVTHFVPTSGSTGARKLIPFTASLQREFNAAICPWLADLVRRSPSLMAGRAYWSVTPGLGGPAREDSVVPIEFDSDSSYLAGARRRLADAVMAVPEIVARSKSIEEFRFETLRRLLICRDLRLISVWHPSFLMLLLDALPDYWDRLITAIQNGSVASRGDPGRARELGRLGPLEPERLWPSLRLVSCWGDAAAELPLEQLRNRFPNVLVQPKGLISTEGFVSLPFEGKYPLAVCSHFLEFIDPRGQVRPLQALEDSGEYEVVLTTGGGLWRYRTGDRVRVTGFLETTPCVRFLGRGSAVSDRFGEKLSEGFVLKALREVFGNDRPRFSMLAPDEDDDGCRYTLYVEGSWRLSWAECIDQALRHNPHYAYCRDLGQLLPVRLFLIPERGYEVYATRMAASGARLGDIKPVVLSRVSGWSTAFRGTYADHQLEVTSA